MIGILQDAIYYFINFLYILIFLRCIISWLPMNRDNPLLNFVYSLTEPILSPIRTVINNSPIGGGALDFSPIFAAAFLSILYRVLYSLLELLKY